VIQRTSEGGDGGGGKIGVYLMTLS
jgi:hypothetical protein